MYAGAEDLFTFLSHSRPEGILISSMASDSTSYRILIVEDGDAKYRSVSGAVDEAVGLAVTKVRAPTVNEADALIASQDWDLILLDVSMDISPGATDRGSRGHANLGGLKIAYRMFLRRREFPTIIVTAHDAFEEEMRRGDGAQLVDLQTLERQAREYLGNHFIGHVRYGNPNWQQTLVSHVQKVFQR